LPRMRVCFTNRTNRACWQESPGWGGAPSRSDVSVFHRDGIERGAEG
jgi:hypothetical protein